MHFPEISLTAELNVALLKHSFASYHFCNLPNCIKSVHNVGPREKDEVTFEFLSLFYLALFFFLFLVFSLPDQFWQLIKSVGPLRVPMRIRP